MKPTIPRVPNPFNHLALSSLAEILTCPRCKRIDHGFHATESLRAIRECYNQRCRQHWYVIWLGAGPVEPQLATIFGEDLAREQMALWQLPERLMQPMFWQLALTRNQFDEHGALSSRSLLAAINRFVRQRIALASHPGDAR
jgi:hypothetical protein